MWAAGGSEGGEGVHWSELAAAFCVGGAVAALAVSLAGAPPEPHPGPYVGELTFSGAGKSRDFLFVWVFAAAAIGAYALIAWIGATLAEPSGSRARYRDHLVYACLPAIFWIASNVLGKPFNTGPYFADLGYLGLSALMALAVPVAHLLTRLGNWRDALQDAASTEIILAPVLAGSSVLSVLIAVTRLFPIPGQIDTVLAVSVAAAVALVVFFLTAALALASGAEERRRVALARLAVAAQAGLPLAAFALILPPASEGLPWPRLHPLTGSFTAILVLAALYGYVALWRAWKRTADANSGLQLPAASVAAIAVLFLFSSGQATPYGMDNPLDYYHHGEWLIPWQQWVQFGKLPYLDYSPSHGLVDYLSGAINDLALDGTLAGFSEARLLVRGASAFALALALTRFCGPLPALLALLLFPVTGRYPIFAAILCGLLFLSAPAIARRPIRWCWAYLLAGTALVLLAPGQGAMLVIAAAPLALLQLWRAYDTHPRRLLVSLCVALLLAVLLLWFGPGEIVVAQIRFMLENSPLYGAVHGLDWERSLSFVWPVNDAFWEVLRTLWLPAALLLLLVAAQGLWPARRSPEALVYRHRPALFALLAGLFLLLVVPHTLGRIDAGAPSRGGAMTVFALALLLLPLVPQLAPRLRAGAYVALTVPLGILAPAFAHDPSLLQLLRAPGAVSAPAKGEALVDGPAADVPAFGRTSVPVALLDRATTLKSALDGWLRPDETYLDLSNANADYFYVDRAVPIESGAIMTLPAPGMQRRSVARLAEMPPPVILLGTEPSSAGPFTLPLRTPVLAHWVFAEIRAGNYVIRRKGSFVFAVRPDRAAGGEGAPKDPDALLRTLFAPPSLEMLPAVWGHSLTEEAKGWMRDIVALPGATGLAGLAAEPDGRYRLTGNAAELHLSVPRDADLLAFDLTCADEHAGEALRPIGLANVTSADGSRLDFRLAAGRLLAPLDAAPERLLGGSAGNVLLQVGLDPACEGAVLSGFLAGKRAATGEALK